MFFYALSGSQKKSFLSLAFALIRSDGIVTSDEDKAFAILQAETGVDGRVEPAELSQIPSITGTFDTRQAKVSVTLELIGLGHADSHFSIEESSIVNEIGRCFDFDPAEIATMENWVLRHLALVREAERFWEQ
jgi:hypothetical protein